MSASTATPFDQLSEDGSLPKQSKPIEDKPIEDNKKDEPKPREEVTIETQSDVKLLEARLAAADARVASLKECMSKIMDDSEDKGRCWDATRWGTVAGALSSAAIATTFASTGRLTHALCAAGVMTTACGAHFLTEGAIRQYHHQSSGRRDKIIPIPSSVQMGLGVLGLAAGIGYFFLLGKRDK